MNLLLISIHIEDSARAVPLGPAMLASSLKQTLPSKLNTSILNLYANQSPSECVDAILKHSPDCIGFSIYVWNRTLTLELATILKQTHPEITLFAGGPEVTTNLDSSIDFILPGESEETIITAMNHLLEGGSPNDISKLITPAPIENISLLPSPFLDQTLNPADYSGMLWELSRGCPFKCDFCFEARGTEGIRRFPLDRIRAELQLFAKSNVEQVFVLDPTFNYNQDSAKEILQLIIDEAPDICFFFEIRSEFVDAEMAKLFALINCSLQIGIQSASDEVLKNINRSIDLDDFENKLHPLHEAGVAYGFDLIYGLPGDTLAGFCDSLDFALCLIPNHVDIFPLTVLPGTRLHETAPSLKLEHQPHNPYLVTSSPTFNENDMALAADLANAFDIFYNKGKAVPWFSIISAVLDMTPSAFFMEFAERLKTRKTDDIISLQNDFIKELFDKHGRTSLTLLATDIITCFGYLESTEENSITLSFNHNPEDLLHHMEHGVADLEELSILLPEQPCEATVNPTDNSISVDDKTPSAHI